MGESQELQPAPCCQRSAGLFNTTGASGSAFHSMSGVQVNFTDSYFKYLEFNNNQING